MKAPAALALLTALFYWKLTLTRQFTFLGFPDLLHQVLPWYQYQARAWHSGTLPLWDPFQWCGQPLPGQWQPGAMFPLNWPLFWLPLHHGGLNIDFWHWHFVGMHVLAAWFMYWYCRDLGRSRWGSALAAASFSYAGYVGTTLWPQMMNGALWTPLVFLFRRRPGMAAAARCGAALGLALLAGHHQPVAFVALAVAALCIFERQIRRLAVIALFAVLAGAAALLPAWEYATRAYRWVNLPYPVRGSQTVPYLAQQDLGVVPLSLLGLATPVDRGTTNPFVGLTAISLALLGVAAGWRERDVRIHSCLALGGLAYALGSYSLYQGILYGAVPLLDKARSPGHAIALFHFAVPALAAFGLDAAAEPSVWKARLVKGLLGAGLLAWLAGFALPAASDRGHAILLSGTVALLLAAAIHRARPAAVLSLMLVELASATNYLYSPRRDLDRLDRHRDIAAFLHRQPRPFRIHADDREIPYNFGDWAGLEDTGGYLASVSAGLYDFIARDWGRSGLWLNQVYVIAREKTQPQQQEVYSSADGLKVFRNPDAFPRAWLVSPPEAAWTPGTRPNLDPAAGSIDVTAIEPHRVTARVRARLPALAVFADPMYPGWRVTVDGQRADALAAYGALRGVRVGAGEHDVEWVYRPWTVYLGLALSALGLAAAVWLPRTATIS